MRDQERQVEAYKGEILRGDIAMRIMSTEELKAKLDRGDEFKLIMTLDRQAFDHMHIPGSLHFSSIHQAAKQLLDPDYEIVVYCSHELCSSSINAYLILRSYGFKNIYRYAGGLAEWQEAGYPLEGNAVDSPVEIELPMQATPQ
jgi:rhodanese-related sulfurtransferase